MSNISASLSGIAIGAVSLWTILSAAIVFLLCYIAIKILLRIVDGILDKAHMEKAMRGFLRTVIKVALWFVAVIIVAESLGIPTASLVALLSVAGLALSLSVQGIMSNLFSGFTILLTKPFAAGDFVQVGGVSGTVKELGLFHTQINTGDNQLIYVPNSEITASKIQNYSHEPLRRVDLTFSVSYNNSTEQVKSALLRTAAENPLVLTSPAAAAHLMTYGDSSIQYVLRAWVNSADYWSVYFALNEAVRETFNREGIEMTYNHINVHVVKE